MDWTGEVKHCPSKNDVSRVRACRQVLDQRKVRILYQLLKKSDYYINTKLIHEFQGGLSGYIFFVSSLHNLANIYIQGSKPPGEYFNPGYDCLDILTQNRKAKDGYYWIDFHLSVPYKVCFQYIHLTIF